MCTTTKRFKLTKLTTLTQVNGTDTIHRAPGCEVNYARTETEQCTIHRVWLVEGGATYEAVTVEMKAQAPAPVPQAPRMPTTYTDGRGKSVTSTLTHEEALASILAANDDRHGWVLYWLHEYSSRIARDARELEIRAQRDAQAKATTGQVEGLDMGKSLRFVSDMFVLAVGRGLKRPMIRLHYGERRYKIYLSPAGTVCLKSGRLEHDAETGSRKPVGNEGYVGHFWGHNFVQARRWEEAPRRRWYGRYYTPRTSNNNLRPFAEGEVEFLRRLAMDPVGFILECSKDMDRCSFCNQPLEDARSKLVGCGKTCAAHWGIRWGDDSRSEQIPSFPELYQRGGDLIAGFCQAIREKPHDEVSWGAFNDYLLDECSQVVGVKMPAEGNPLLPRQAAIAKAD